MDIDPDQPLVPLNIQDQNLPEKTLSVEKVNGERSSTKATESSGSKSKSDRDVPAEEYAELRKDFYKKLRDMLSSSKPYSKSKIISVSQAACKRAYLYKAVEIALSSEVDNAFDTNSYDAIRGMLYLSDAIIGRSKKVYRSKEQFSARLFPFLTKTLDRLMKLSPAVLTKEEKEKKEQKKQVSELRKTKREVLRIVHVWLGKGIFKDPAPIKEIYDTWASHFPELKALETISAKKGSEGTKKSKKKPEPTEKTKIKRQKTESSKHSKITKETTVPETSKAKFKEEPRNPHSFVTTLPATSIPLPPSSAAPSTSSAVNGSATTLTHMGVASDLESRIKSMAATGKLPIAGFDLKPPELPAYATVPLAALLTNPAFLPPPGPPPALLAAILDPFSLHKDNNHSRPLEPPRQMRSFDPLDNVPRWYGFMVPRNRPQHFTVVSSLLSLHYLPKVDDKAKTISLIKQLFSYHGQVSNVSMAQTSAVIRMENRYSAGKVKKNISESNPKHKSMEVVNEVEKAFLDLIRSKKVLMEWYPSDVVKNKYLKYWESTPQGIAFIPHDICNEYVNEQGYDRYEFSTRKFEELVRELVRSRDTLIVVDSLPNIEECRDVYRKVLSDLFPEAMRR